MEQPIAHHLIALPDIPAVGDVIAEKYRVEGILGVGGMGVVLGARHLQLGQSVAIKVLSVGQEQRSDAVERFLREGRAAAALCSDHVIRIYDVGQLTTGLPYMVMERLRGEDLATLLVGSEPLGIAEAVDYVAQATMAIIEAHEVGVVHRDLKPANLFRTQRSDGSICIKVLDFGISKQLTDLETETMPGALTSTRQVMGSPAYMSPEQVRDAKNVDHRTDIWALGVTLYELLTKHAAFDAETLPAICAAIAADPPVPIRSRRADVPDSVVSIIGRCLEKNPSDRFPTARALLGALRGNLGGELAVNSREATSPLTPKLAIAEPVIQQVPELEPAWSESGPRSIDTPRSQGADGTLVSGRSSPLISPEASVRRPNGPIQRMKAVALAVLVCGGAATAWFVTRSSATGASSQIDDPNATSNQPQPPIREQSATLQPTATPIEEPRAHGSPERTAPSATSEARVRFVLRIESKPSQALVTEGGNPLGVTPLLIEIDRAIVRHSPRSFLVRKAGYVEVAIQQGDSSSDVRQFVTLSRARESAHDAKPAKPPGHASSTAMPSSSAPGIRISR